MLNMLRQLNQRANRRAGALLLAGLAGVVAYNMQRWPRDRALARRLRAEPPAAPRLARAPQVSALVAAWNEATNIDAHLQSFLALSYPDIELILCAGGSDDTLARARRYAGERVIVLEQHPGEGKQRALARCFAHASGAVIYLTDADCWFDDTALGLLLAEIVNQGEQAATGRFAPLPGLRRRPFVANQWAVDTYARAHSGPYVGGLIGRNAALTRTALEQSGALQADVPIGTDYYLARRLIAQGRRIRYVHASATPTDCHTRLRPYLRQQTRWLRNIVVHGRRFQAHAEVAGALRACGAGIVAMGMPLLALRLGPCVLAAWATGLGLAAANRVRYLAFAAACGQQVTPAAYLTAPLYALIDLGMLAYAGLDIALRREDRW